MRISTLLPFLLLPLICVGQSEEELFFNPSDYASSSVHLLVGLPGPDLRAADYPVGWGGQMKLFTKSLLEGDPFLQYRFGLSGDLLVHGGRNSSAGQQVAFTGEVNNLQLGMYSTVRLETTPSFPVQLYVDGLLGARGFIIDWSQHYGTEGDCFEVDSGAEGSWHFSYGLGFGTKIRVSDNVRLDLGATYLTMRGTPQFADLESVILSTKDISYTTRSAAAQQWNFQVGLSFDLIPGWGGDGSDDDGSWDCWDAGFSGGSCGW